MRFDRDISTTIEIDAAPPDVWAALESIEDHVNWMADAVAITFRTDQRRGVGTQFVCDTKVGPITLVDEMEVTTWTPGVEMGVAHRGVISGAGSFHLQPIDLDRRCRIVWSETLSFPWWLAGPVGASVAARALRRIWQRNLRRLRADVEARR